MVTWRNITCVVVLLVFFNIMHPVVFAIQPTTGTWIEGAPMRIPRFEMSVTDINGKIFAIGGVDRHEY